VTHWKKKKIKLGNMHTEEEGLAASDAVENEDDEYEV
jgi:hypothetical protein